MVTTGFSRIHVAQYKCEGGKATYSGCRELARARSMTSSITTAEDNDFYANNAVAETESAVFESGKVDITVDGLTAEEEAFIMGIAEDNTVTVGDKEVPVYRFGKNMNPPYVGIGAVKRMKLAGVTSYRPVVFTKGRFAVPSDDATTGEKTINWQDQGLSATLMRDDTESEDWKIIPKENFPSEAEAVEFIKAVLGGGAA